MSSKSFRMACLCLFSACFVAAESLAEYDVRSGMNADAEAVADALWFAAADGDLQRFSRLLARSATAGWQNREPTSALWIASQQGHTEIVRFLLGLGADVEAKDASDGRTALFQASQEGHAAIVSLLLESGAQIEVPSRKTGATPLFIAAARGHTEVVRLLLAAQADVNVTASAGGRQDSPLSIARQRGHTRIVELLEQSGGSAPIP
jgi:ankyrin repeat protein